MSESKACPLCGEQILAVAVKCKHCGSDVGGSRSPVERQFKMRPAFVVMLAVILVVVGAGLIANWNRTGALSGHGFTDADVANMEQNIASEFNKRQGVKVVEVKMLKESPTKMGGYVKMKIPLLGEMQKSCTATLGETGQSIWQCG